MTTLAEHTDTLQCPVTKLYVKIDTLIEEGFTVHPFAATLQEIKVTVTGSRHYLITKMTGCNEKEKKQLITNACISLAEMQDDISNHLQLLSRKNLWEPEYRALLYEIKKLLVYIQHKWGRYCSTALKISNNDLLHLRCRLQQRLTRLHKRLGILDKPLRQAILEPILNFMQTKDTHTITTEVAARAERLVTTFEQIAEAANFHTTFTDAVALHLLLQLQYTTPRFMAWHRHYLQQQCNLLPTIPARIAFIQTACAQVQHLAQEQAGSDLANLLLPWMEQLVVLLEKQEQSNRQQEENTTRNFARLMYKEAGGVVAEFFQMLAACDFLLNTDLGELFKTIAMYAELPQTRNPCGSYLYSEARRHSPRYRKIILDYLPLFKAYLLDEQGSPKKKMRSTA